MNRILCVDDDQSFQKSLKAMLRHTVRLESSYSIQDAFSALERNPFDLIVLDHRLPDGDGLDFLERLRSPLKEIPIVVLTGYPSPDIHQKYSSWKQVRNFLTKPLYPDTLDATLKELMPCNINGTEEVDPFSYLNVNNATERFTNVVKNNLTALRGIIEIFSFQLKTYTNRELADKGFECIENVNKSFDEMKNQLIKQSEIIHHRTRKQKIEDPFGVVDLTGFLDQIKNAFVEELEQYQIEFQYSINDNLTTIETNVSNLETFLRYLIKNACNRLKLTNHAKIQISVFKKGSYYLFQINDNGQCIPEPYFATRQSIFNTASKGNANYTSILHTIHAMGWDLETQSSNGYGNMITLKILAAKP